VNVLCDRHHAGLFHSLQLLGDRLGWTVYTPVGRLWWDAEYWNFGRHHWGDDRLAEQFLNPNQPPADPEFPDRSILTVSLPQAMEMTWDLVIATVEDNQLGFYRFAKERGAKYAVHVGNTNQLVHWNLEPLVLNASEVPGGVHIGEEFDSDGMFGYSEPHRSDSPRIASFVNCMPQIACYPLLQEAQALLPEAQWRIFGIDGPDGVLKPISDIANTMRSADWAWHDKEHGDGYGVVLHAWASVGRPLIGHASHYFSKTGARYWLDGVTAIDLDQHSIPEAVEMIRTMTPERHREMCRAIRATFDQETDWEADAQRVAELIGQPVPV
jgi:hypothetical protein